ncbi:dihydrodipicolinate synthase family protein [Streptomyces sp. HNM0575]|uniref:dihydrodipicolinate synthase family protein n=1 Tax=Streptomyces sp. HNM0575 TaxID=2716338 RepID=UPI00145DBD70|nr:dihydrodipicolinate synthase family protein [Streptomyces sp. HNM0575]NLU74375.1 dihydrodipicolinate synthase family protein [Streptomyces sp. HNM0575]
MSSTAIARSLHGVVAVPVTPFGPDGQVAQEEYSALLHRMAGAGIRAFTPNGNTGEYYALSPDERRRLVELTVREAPGALVIAGVGLDLASAVADAQAAHAAGAGAVMVHQPVHPYRSVAGWIAYHAALAEAVPGVSIVAYVKDATLGSDDFAALAAACPGLVGVKYAVPDPPRLAVLVEELGRLGLVWLCGVAELWAPYFALSGAAGFTSGLACVDPRRSVGLFQALTEHRNAEAMRLWREIRRFEELRARNGAENNVSVVKEALAQLGLSRREVRPPITPVDDGDREAVAEILAGWGLRPRRGPAGDSPEAAPDE